jgi:aspartyl-tRNA(Asn)/glutamyl-tRNA(Gln) amidotransferase subunit B
MRSKEQAHDYRYFPDPDLVPVEIDAAQLNGVKQSIPGSRLPWNRFARYHGEYGLDVKQATQLIDNLPLADYFDRCVDASKNPQQSMNFVLGDLSRLANETGTPVHESAVTADQLAELIALVEGKTINSKIAKELLQRMWNGGGSPKAIVDKEGLAQTSDTDEIEKFVADVLASNEKAVADYRAGKTNILGFLTGQVMKVSRGKANPALVQDLLKKKLA